MATITAPYPRRLPAPAPPSLLQFLLLSILLHVLVVLIFGTPERIGGGPLGAWRDVPFAVTLRPLAGERESPWKPSYGGEQGAAGSSLSRRAPSRTPAPTPPAAAEPAPPATPEPPANRESPVSGTLPRLDEGAPEIVDKPIRPEAEIRPQETPTPAVPRVDLEAPRSMEPEAPPKRETLAPLPPIVERPVPPTNAPVAPPKLESPTLPEAPAAALPRLELETPPRAMPELEPLMPAPGQETLPSTRMAPAPSFENERPPVAEPTPKRETAVEAPPTVQPETTPPKAAPPVASPAPQAAPREAPPPTPSREAPLQVDGESPAATTAEPPGIPRLRYGAPPDDDIFAPRSSPSAIDADAARKAVRETARAESRRTGIVPLDLFPAPPEPESKLGRAIQKAAQPDCRDAYAAMGLLAIPFLLKDAVTDTGCRW